LIPSRCPGQLIKLSQGANSAQPPTARPYFAGTESSSSLAPFLAT
jgi:hypothetical protein